MDLWLSIYAGVLGACVGSFLNVVIYRLPRGLSLWRPRSRCTTCDHSIRWYHNLPLVSYLALRGRCAYCEDRIAPRYLVVEGVTALAFAVLAATYRSLPTLPFHLVAVSLLIAAAEIDRKHHVIPNALIGTGLVLGSGLVVLFQVDMMPERLMMGAGIVVVSLCLRQASVLLAGRPGLGMGDVKLLGLTGFLLGQNALWVTYLAFIIGGTIGIAGLLMGRLSRSSRLPFAPFLTVAVALWYVAAGIGLL